MQQTIKTAGLLVIGDEILSGRTKDTNTNAIALRLTETGINLREVRVIPDETDIIVAALRDFSVRFDYVFTTGGIGPTHDDKTAQAVAIAFDAPLERNAEAYARMVRHYGGESEMNPGRAKMADIPFGAALIDNPVSIAPGFIVKNVHVMAGVPHIMAAMLDSITPRLKGGPKVHSFSVSAAMGESRIAPGLEAIQNKYPDLSIGSYPRFNPAGPSVTLVARGTDAALAQKAVNDIAAEIRRLGGEPVFE